jgi:hypothetical protein
MVLNITNGTVLKEYLLKKHTNDEKIISFNESMITGESTESIFDDAFFRVRAKSLRISFAQYLQKTVAELDELINRAHSKIVLWFDKDMFCQINALTLCAYLDCIQFNGKVQLNIIPQRFWQYEVDNLVIKSYDINIIGFYSVHRDVLVQKAFNESDFPDIDEMRNGIRLYENYVSDNSEIKKAIKEMVQNNQSKIYIVNEIMKRYPDYGIGDYNIELLYREETQTKF